MCRVLNSVGEKVVNGSLGRLVGDGVVTTLGDVRVGFTVGRGLGLVVAISVGISVGFVNWFGSDPIEGLLLG